MICPNKKNREKSTLDVVKLRDCSLTLSLEYHARGGLFEPIDRLV
jgi:hypothetical protein